MAHSPLDVARLAWRALSSVSEWFAQRADTQTAKRRFTARRADRLRACAIDV